MKLLEEILSRGRATVEERAFVKLASNNYGRSRRLSQQDSTKSLQLVFLCEQFFHADLNGFGGFGKTVQNIAQHFNAAADPNLQVRLALSQPLPIVSRAEQRVYHDTEVLLRPARPRTDLNAFSNYEALLNNTGRKLFLSIDWYPSYRYPLYAASGVPLIIWIHDPRSAVEWEKIASSKGEWEFRGLDSPAELSALALEKSSTLGQLRALQRKCPRPIVFAHTTQFLIPRAERTYGIKVPHSHWLPNPIAMPQIGKPEFKGRPMLLFLARLDPQKRPWVAFELAKRHPEIDFVMAGIAHAPQMLETWARDYRHLSNLQFLGHIDGQRKDELLQRCWAVLNTAIHEGEPVAFLEAFSYGKPVISCQDPDEEVSKFGYYTGEILGDGLDSSSLERFSEQIDHLMSNPRLREEKGRAGMAEMHKNHTFESFRRHLDEIIDTEKLL